METQVYEYYQSTRPGQLVCLGPDVMSSGTGGSLLQSFRVQAGGLQFPLLRDCADGFALADTNLLKPYVERDNYAVIDQQGIVRYFAGESWLYGNRFHIGEIRAAIDPLLANAGVGGPGARAWSFAATPNPAHGEVAFTLVNPTAMSEPAEISVYDPGGRRLVRLAARPAGAGSTTFRWNGLGTHGEQLPAGLYLAEARVAGQRLVRRVVLAR